MDKIKDDIIQQSMNKLFATNYSFYLLAQKYHWNATGINFYMTHKFLEEIYEELAEDNDKIAECIRAMGYFVPATFKEIMDLSAIQDTSDIDKTSPGMMNKVHEACNKVQLSIIAVLQNLHKPSDEGTMSLLTDMLQRKDKLAWLIKSHII